MHDENEPIEYTAAERALFDALPRESELNTLTEQRLVNTLRAEGYFRARVRRTASLVAAAAAVACLVAGGIAGYQYGMRNSLENRLSQTNLSLNDRVLLLQRAGSAYVRAANGYADATTRVDSTAVEVAQQILMGAAQAVARRSMDGGLTVRLARAMQTSGATQ
ncbi:MAG TPA: hypothetical protein VE967_02910 [Gemmatimonadaceae bacterium]|nr:hypothetical protein [Gemmatimonadaceae bacterium]